MPDLQSIVYVSSAVHEMNETELDSLLQEARTLNLETNTTGVLLYSGGSFMQCFEGTREAVGVTYDRIRNSKRHHTIIELLNETVEARAFPDWQMGFVLASQAEALRLSTGLWQRRFDMQTAAPGKSNGLELLESFWAQAQRRA